MKRIKEVIFMCKCGEEYKEPKGCKYCTEKDYCKLIRCIHGEIYTPDNICEACPE